MGTYDYAAPLIQKVLDNAGRLPIKIAKERLGDSQHLEPFENADRAARSFWERWFQ